MTMMSRSPVISRRRRRTVMVDRRRDNKYGSRSSHCSRCNNCRLCHNARGRGNHSCRQTQHIPHKVDDISSKADAVVVMMAMMVTGHCRKCAQSHHTCDQKHLESFHFSHSFFCFLSNPSTVTGSVLTI